MSKKRRRKISMSKSERRKDKDCKNKAKIGRRKAVNQEWHYNEQANSGRKC